MPRKTRYTKAIVLNYDSNQDAAPVVALKGRYVRADEIVKIAKRYGVPVVEQAELAEELERVEHNSPIPEALFEAVALLLNQLERSLAKVKEIRRRMPSKLF